MSEWQSSGLFYIIKNFFGRILFLFAYIRKKLLLIAIVVYNKYNNKKKSERRKSYEAYFYRGYS